MGEEMREKVEEAVEQYIRPYLHADGGDMEVLDITDGIVHFRLTGHCAGCAAADYTAEQFINTTLTEHVKDIKKAVLVTVTSQELIDQAKAILRQRRAS